MKNLKDKLDTLNLVKPKIGLNEGAICTKHDSPFREINFRVWKCPLCEEERKSGNKQQQQRDSLHSNLNLSSRFKGCTIEDFIADTKEKKVIKEKVKGYVSAFPDIGGLVMLGGVGTGKTHMSSAICTALCDKMISCRTTTVNRIIREVRASWGGTLPGEVHIKSEGDVIKDHAKVGFLVIDEIGSQYGTDSEKIIINEIINDRYENCLPTAVIGNLTRSEIKEILGVRVYDRLLHNGVELIFDWKSHRQKN